VEEKPLDSGIEKPTENLPATEVPPAEPAVEPYFKVAGFWRRLFAFIVDGVIIGVGCFVAAFLLMSSGSWLGPFGRLIGLIVGTLYFGILNSRMFKATIGKHILAIHVVDKDGQPLTVSRSILRALILTLILMLNGWAITTLPSIVLLQTYLLFVGIILLIYGLVFDRKTRQLIHDVLVGSYVVHGKPQPGQTAPQRPSIHKTLTLWFSVVSLFICIGSGVFVLASPLHIPGLSTPTPQPGESKSLYETLASDKRFHSVIIGVNTRTQLSGSGAGSELTSLRIDVWYKGDCSSSMEECRKIQDDIAGAAFDLDADMEGIDGIIISVQSKVDLGWATYQFTAGNALSIEDWKDRLDIRD
jgi:uncharacterized RDD family membrane protein YckC